MTYIMLAILAATTVSAFRQGNDLLSPSRLYICVYSVLLAVYHLNLSKLQTPWSLTAILLFYGASVMFLFGGLWIWLLGKIQRPSWSLDFDEVRKSLSRDADKVDWTWFKRVYAVSIFIYTVSFLVSMAVIGGIPIFMKNTDDARIKFFGATLPSNYGIFMGPTALMLGMVLLLFSKPDRQQRRKILLSMGFVLALYMAIVTRYDLFRFLIFTVVLYHYGVRKLKPVHMLTGLGIGLSVFLMGFLVRVKTDSISAFNEIIKVKMPHHLAWASNIYAYLANDFWNFDFAVKKYIDGDYQYPTQYGLSLFRALLMNLRLDTPLIQSYRFDTMYNESVTKVSGLNTVIYVWHFYKDFGMIGTFLLPLLAGLFAWKFYLNTLMSPSVFRISIWAVFAGAIALSYHNPMWELWFVYLNLLTICVATRKLRAF
jgi:oligosaccharide repeat unit polymerase